MKHARSDYSQIQDPTGKIPEDEPVFLIRAQDVAGPDTVKHWAILAEARGAKANVVESAKYQARLMRDWQRENRIKIPDMPKEADVRPSI